MKACRHSSIEAGCPICDLYRTNRVFQRVCDGLHEPVKQPFTIPVPVQSTKPPKGPKWVSVIPWTVPEVRPTSDRLVITVATGRAAAELAFTGPRMKRYAERHGADFVAITEGSGQVWPLAEKWRITDYAMRYRRTLFLDADVWVSDSAPDLFADESPVAMADDWTAITHQSWVDPEVASIAKSQGLPPPPKWSRMWNSGVIIGGPEAFDLYRPMKRPFISVHCAEQHWFQMELDRHGIPITPLDRRWNWIYFQADFWKGLKTDEPHFVHLANVRPIDFRPKLLERFDRGEFDRIDIPAPRPGDSPGEAWRPSWWQPPSGLCPHLGPLLNQEEKRSLGFGPHRRRGRCALGMSPATNGFVDPDCNTAPNCGACDHHPFRR
jgi:hypothetical protein